VAILENATDLFDKGLWKPSARGLLCIVRKELEYSLEGKELSGNGIQVSSSISYFPDEAIDRN
jgi:hypothetical protein